ncbi:MAG: HEAT repeat domain-containing protein [Pseudomonadota bacterium]
MITKVISVVLLLAVMAGSWFYLNKPPQPGSTENTPQADAGREAPVTSNTFDTTALVNDTDNSGNVIDNANVVDNAKPLLQEPSVDVTEVGLSPLTDEQYAQIQSQLGNDNALLDRLLEEFRYNTNPQRATQLAALLGEHNLPEVVDVAAELAYSGDPLSQRMGLDLLSRLQAQNSRARDIAIELLSSESDPSLLVSTMNVLAIPSNGASAEQRNALYDNTALLASHHDYRVRSHSIALIGRWNKEQGVAVLADALADPHEQVRARAVSAMHGLTNPGTNVINRLFDIAENTNEQKTTRQSALFSLKKMPLSTEQQQRYRQAQISVRTRQLK